MKEREAKLTPKKKGGGGGRAKKLEEDKVRVGFEGKVLCK